MSDEEVAMDLFKTRVVVPVNRKTFVSDMGKLFALQTLLIIAFVILMYSGFKDSKYSLLVVWGMLLVFVVITIYDIRKCDYQGRFKDIYPDHELPISILAISFLFPIIYFPFAIFLCLREKSSGKNPFKIFYMPSRFFMTVIPLFLFQLSVPRFAYWTASPSFYYIADILQGSKEILQLKENLDKANILSSPVDIYVTNDTKINSTEVVLLTAVTTGHVIKMKRKESETTDNQKIENNINYSLVLLKEISKLLTITEQTKFEFFDYSLLQWANPSGVVEILLLTAVNSAIERKNSILTVDRAMGILQNMEKGLSKLPAETQAFYRLDITKIKADLMSTRAYRSLATIK